MYRATRRVKELFTYAAQEIGDDIKKFSSSHYAATLFDLFQKETFD